MRISAAAVLFAVAATSAQAFQLGPIKTTRSLSSSSRSSSVNSLKSSGDFNEFDFILGERTVEQQALLEQTRTGPAVQSRRRILLSDGKGTVLASSTTFAAPGVEDETMAFAEDDSETAALSDDPYADFLEESPSQLQKYTQEKQSFSQSIENKLKTMDLQDIVSTLIIPSIITFAGVRWGVNKVSARVAKKTDATLDLFANEMIYHDADFEEMGMCFNDYSKKLMWLGPRKTPVMLKRYLQLYAKKKTVSPQAIR
jgi:hypothetical protein